MYPGFAPMLSRAACLPMAQYDTIADNLRIRMKSIHKLWRVSLSPRPSREEAERPVDVSYDTV